MKNNKFDLGIFNVYSFYDGKVNKAEWLNSIKNTYIRQITEAEFLYYEGNIIESYNLLTNIIDKASKENNYNALIGATSMLFRVSLMKNDYDSWQKSIKLLYDNYKNNPLLCDFMISGLYCYLDYYEFASSFINQKYVINESWRPQYNYLIMAMNSINLSEQLESLDNKNESIIQLIQLYLIKAIKCEIEVKKINYIQQAFDLSISNNFIMPLVEMGIPLSHYYSNKYIKNYQNEMKVIKRIIKNYSNCVTKIYIDNNENELTLKEFTALFFVAQGKKNKEIAKIMDISENTLKYYLKLAFEKMNIKKRREVDKIIVNFEKNIKMGGKK